MTVLSLNFRYFGGCSGFIAGAQVNIGANGVNLLIQGAGIHTMDLSSEVRRADKSRPTELSTSCQLFDELATSIATG